VLVDFDYVLMGGWFRVGGSIMRFNLDSEFQLVKISPGFNTLLLLDSALMHV
jgi:hypothetical protein